MTEELKRSIRSWAHLRFSIIGPLLARPPEKGELQQELKTLANRRYPHPTKKDAWVTFGVSTIERWYYQALGSDDPVAALGRKLRADSGQRRAVCGQILQILHSQYLKFPQWSYRLHADNLTAHLEKHPELGDAPSYASVRREMVHRGWRPSRRPRTAGQHHAAERLEKWEVRGFESQYNHALWHLDFHEGRRRVVDCAGTWHTPKALCVLDDRSRLCCHLQWYLAETAENLIHALTQAFHKRGLPRALMTDNGAAMVAHETTEGLMRLGIVHEKTLPYSPYQNGKQEAFWAQLEGRLLAMLSQVNPLTLEFLNRSTQAWVELEYNRSRHEEIGTSPIKRLLEGPAVSRPAPSAQAIRLAFSIQEARTQRRSDGTLQIRGVRFEVPARFRNLGRLHVRYQSWDLTVASLVDERTAALLSHLYPQDKIKNAKGLRRTQQPLHPVPSAPQTADSIPPLLKNLLAEYAATGLPPAYIPKEETPRHDTEDHDDQ